MWVHPQNVNRSPPRWEANGWPTVPLRLCIGVMLLCFHRAAPPLPPSNLTGPLTGHCVTRRIRTCKERNGTGEGMWFVIMSAFHITGTKHGEALTEGQRSRLFTSSARNLVKHPLKGNKANDRITLGSNVARHHLTGKSSFIVCVGASLGREPLPHRQESNSWPTEPVRLCIGVKLQSLSILYYLLSLHKPFNRTFSCFISITHL